MRLKETNWDAPGGAAEYGIDYPDAPIADFVDWIRKTSAWLENPELIERRVRRLNGVLADWRNRPREKTEGPGVRDVTLSGQVVAIAIKANPLVSEVAGDMAVSISRASEIKATRQANMAKAQAALKAKREAARAAHTQG